MIHNPQLKHQINICIWGNHISSMIVTEYRYNSLASSFALHHELIINAPPFYVSICHHFDCPAIKYTIFLHKTQIKIYKTLYS